MPQLLPGSPVTLPQFASLSFLVKRQPQQQHGGDGAAGATSSSSPGMGEPMLVASPLATVSGDDAVGAVRELHEYLTAIKAAAAIASSGKVPPHERLALELFREDDKLLEHYSLQVFRPRRADGLALHYRLLRGDDKLVANLSAHVMSATKPGGKPSTTTTVPAGLIGIVFCVATSGTASASIGSPSGLEYSLPQRMSDCTSLLTKISDTQSAKVVLSTFLMTEDELRKTNEMAQAPNVVVFPDASGDDDKAKRLLAPMGMSNITGGVVKASKRLGKPIMGAGAGGTSAGGGGDDDDDDENPLRQVGVTMSLRPNSAVAALEMTENLTVLSVAEADTCLRTYAKMGQERKANVDLTGGGKSRFQRRSRKGENARDADLDNFDYKGPAKVVKKKTLQQMNSPRGGGSVNAQSQLQFPTKKDTRTKTSSSSSVGGSRADSVGRRSSTASGGGGDSGFDPFQQAQQQHKHRPQHRPSASQGRRRSTAGYDHHDDVSLMSDGRSMGHSSQGSVARMQVNIALNEDLSCSYKLSQLSSCSVEGVVQVFTSVAWLCSLEAPYLCCYWCLTIPLFVAY